MKVVGIVGSPRRDGRTNRLMDTALKGAKCAGAATKKIYLADYQIRPFTSSGGANQDHQYCPEELSTLCEGADAIALGAPVYWGDTQFDC